MASTEMSAGGPSASLEQVLATLSPTLPRQELIARALEGALLLTGADRSTLFVRTEDGLALDVCAVAGPPIERFRCDARRGIVGACFSAKQPLVIPDAYQDPRFNRDIDRKTGYQTRSLLAIPLVSPEGAVLGVVEALCPKPGMFGAEHAGRLFCLCPSIVLALSADEAIRRVRRAAASVNLAELGLIGESAAFREMVQMALLYASSEENVLITGESGSGKELVARLIHRASLRGAASFAPVNCATLPETLADSLLFGQVKGAHSGAYRDAIGLFGRANGGTVFLDEVGELYQAVQAKLLRVLQEKEYCRLGEQDPTPANVRVFSATGRPVHPGEEGSVLRPDLYYRLAPLELPVPPCRERGGDVILIFMHALRGQLGNEVRISSEVRELLSTYPWPGNVRQVLSVAARAALLARGEEEVRVEHVRKALERPGVKGVDLPPNLMEGPLNECVKGFKRERVMRALIRCGGNKTKAAAELGLSREGLTRLITALGIDLRGMSDSD